MTDILDGCEQVFQKSLDIRETVLDVIHDAHPPNVL